MERYSHKLRRLGLVMVPDGTFYKIYEIKGFTWYRTTKGIGMLHSNPLFFISLSHGFGEIYESNVPPN